MAQEPTSAAEERRRAEERAVEERRRRYGLSEILMLAIIMGSLSLVFLVGMAIMVNADGFAASDIVAVISPALAAVGTVAAGVFGYTVGTRGAAAAQETASEASREAMAVRQEAAAISEAAAPLARATRRIVKQAIDGAPTPTGKRDISEDDLNTLSDAADALGERVGPRV